MYVEFGGAGGSPAWQRTAAQAVVPGKSTNFLVAGLLPETAYQMRSVLSDGTTSAPVLFTTGGLPAGLNVPAFTVRQPPSSASDPSQGMVFHSILGPLSALVTDLAGRVEWYYDPTSSGFTSQILAPTLVPGGTVLLLGFISGDGEDHGGGGDGNVLREVDLAGNTVRETNVAVVSAQLAARGWQPVTDFNHEAVRLPNGYTAILAGLERTVDVGGTPTVYRGDAVLVLDQNFQVTWDWNPFDHLEVNRGPTLGDAGPEWIDWTHANSIAWSPADGDLLVSLRSQDWVVKIDYRGGGGDGHVVWRLGQGGDFALNSSDPYPWFSHQHDARYLDPTTLILFDDGNTRVAALGGGNSRGQVLSLNEQTMQARLVVNADLGNYSFALGSAQRTPNGNFVFTSGIQPAPDGSWFGQAIEVSPDGTPAWVLEVPNLEYRAYRIGGLYAGGGSDAVAWPAAPSGLSARAAGPREIDLAWTRNSAGETGFKVLRSTDGVNFAQVGTAPAGATTYADTSNLSPSTTYYYRVVVTNSSGDFAPSNTASATTPAGPPGVPSGFVAQGDGTSVTLSWSPAAGATAYNVYRSTSPGGEGAVPLLAGWTATALTDTGVAKGATYYYQVSAIGPGGEGARSAEATAYVPTDPQRFVRALYLGFLGRTGSVAEWNFWAAWLPALGTAGVANAVLRSPEALDRLATGLYVQLLGRAPVGGEERYWVGLMAGAGWTTERVVAGILASPEFAARANALVGSPSADANFIQALYGLLLHRPGGAGEVSYWAGVLPASGRQGVAQGVLGSAEFRAGAVWTFYGGAGQASFPYEPFLPALLRRPTAPAAWEVDYWARSAADLLRIELGFASAPEFFYGG
jgi:hypothetical protein